jgi:hypothetical protein
MNKLKAEIYKWSSGIYSVHMHVRGASFETGNYKSKAYAKKAFVYACNVLGISRDKYEFIDHTF